MREMRIYFESGVVSVVKTDITWLSRIDVFGVMLCVCVKVCFDCMISYPRVL